MTIVIAPLAGDQLACCMAEAVIKFELLSNDPTAYVRAHFILHPYLVLEVSNFNTFGGSSINLSDGMLK